MMKTWCVAVVVLSLSSVGQAAPLACDTLLKPVDKTPDVLGRWYLIAMSSDVCLVPATFSALFWPSVSVDVTLKEQPNRYNGNFTLKLYGYCTDELEEFLFENNTLIDLDSNNVPTGDNDVLLHTSCPDCLVLKGKDLIDSFLLFSRRTSVSTAELSEFEAQAKCLGWSKPEVLNTDHDYQNCKSLDEDSDVDMADLSNKMYQRLKSTYTLPLSCLLDNISALPELISELFD